MTSRSGGEQALRGECALTAISTARQPRFFVAESEATFSHMMT
jgi:hypothetical protein